MNTEIRVRFAPSPTGPLHMGGVRTALYNYLFARQNNGKFILRIEDTDQNRFVEGAENYIIQSLTWCGISFDEGVNVGGPFAPYRQSERKGFYKQYALQLIENGYAYYAFDTPEELENLRKEAESAKEKPFQYDSSTRLGLNNSLSLETSEVIRLLGNDTPYVIRIKIPADEIISFQDEIRGRVEFNSSLLDDKVLYKSDGMPTYHLANVVDDYLMKITHVIRGEEWLPSAPLHVLLYRFLGWEPVMPVFVHLPLLLKPDGKGKLSKRDGDRLGFPVFPLQWKDPQSGEISSGYRETGYLPNAFINMLAFLGWNPGTEQEIFNMDELIDSFSFDRVSKSGARFDADKAKWFNHHYIQHTPNNELAALLQPYFVESNITFEIEKVTELVALIKDRANLIPELWEQMKFFILPPTVFDEQLIRKRWKPEISASLNEIASLIIQSDSITADDFSSLIKNYITEKGLNMGSVMFPLRISQVGNASGPDLFLIMQHLGKEEVASRIERAVRFAEKLFSA
jgi:glutamyl-tRNA synthetase